MAVIDRILEEKNPTPSGSACIRRKSDISLQTNGQRLRRPTARRPLSKSMGM